MGRQRIWQWLSSGRVWCAGGTAGTLIAAFAVSIQAQTPSPTSGAPTDTTSTPDATVYCQQEQLQAIEAALTNQTGQLRQAIEQQQWEAANQILLHLIQTIETIPVAQNRANWVTNLILEAGNADQALWSQVIEHATTRQPDSIAALLEAVIQLIQRFDNAYSSLKTRTWVVLADAYRHLEQPQQATAALAQALQASRTIQGAEFKTNALTAIATAYLAIDQPQLAIEVLNQSQTEAIAIEHSDRNRRNIALSRVGVAYAQADRPDAALRIAAQIAGTPPAQGAVLLAVTRSLSPQDIAAAAQLAQTIPHPESQAIALTEVARQYIEQGNRRAAATTFARAVQVARLMTDAEFTLEQITSLYAVAQPNAALSIARSIQDPEKRSNVLFEIALRYQLSGRAKRAEAVIQEVVTTVPQVSSDWQTFHLQHLITRAIEADAYGLAIMLTEGLTDSFLVASRDPLLLDIVDAAVQDNQLAAARQATEAIPRANPYLRSQALQQLATAYIQTNETEKALDLIDRLDPAYPLQQVQLQAAIARELWRMGETEAAVALFAQTRQQAAMLSTATEQIEAWGSLLLEQSNATRSNDSSDLDHAFTNSLIDDQIGSLNDLLPDSGNAASDASVFAAEKTAMIDQLQAVVQQLPDDYTGSTYLRGIVERLSIAGHLDIALRVAMTNPLDAERNSQLSTVGYAALLAGKPEMVMQVVQVNTAPEQQVRTLLELANRYIQTNQSESALPLLTQAVQLARRIPDPESRVLTLGTDGGTVVEDESDRGSLLESIAITYGQLNRPEALEVAELIQDKTLRDRVKQRLQCFR